MTTSTLPRIDLAELPRLDAEPGCTFIVEGVQCSQPAVWRLITRCLCCHAVLCELACEEHRQLVEASMRDPSTAPTWVSSCCQSPLSPLVWERL